MKSCPFCKTSVPSEASTCPQCGRGLPGRPASGANAYHEGEAFPEIPDIELAPPAPRSAAAKPAPAAASSGMTIDDDDSLGGLELGVSPGARAPAALSTWEVNPLDDDGDDAIALETEALPSRPGTLAKTSSAATARGIAPLESFFPPKPELDPVEVMALADFGTAPRGWFDAAPYALRVRRRRVVLKAEIERQHKLLAEYERANDRALAGVVESLRSRVGPDHPAYAQFKTLGSIDELTSSRDAALRATSEQYAADVGGIDANIAQREGERAACEEAVSRAKIEVDHHAEERARAEARRKRADIALRAAHDAARAAAGPNAKFAPPEHARRIKELEVERDATLRALEPIVAATDAAMTELRRHEAREREARRAITALRSDRRRIEEAAARQLEVRAAGVEDAEKERLRSYVAAARVLVRIAASDIPPEDHQALADAQRLVNEHAFHIEKHVAALASADAEGERRGRLVIAAGIVLCAILLLLTVRTASR